MINLYKFDIIPILHCIGGNTINTCKYCSREINNKGSLTAHQNQCINNPERVVRKRSPLAGAQKGCKAHNKGVPMSDAQKKKLSSSLKASPLVTGKASTPEKELLRIKRITDKAKLNNGGYREGSGRGMKGWYKNIFCDSSWELAFLIYHLDNDIEITRCKEVRKYIYADVERDYHPDFVVENTIYEIKGYVTDQSIAKSLANPDIKIINKHDIKFYLDYAVDTYGKDFVSLYETKK